MGFTVRSAYTVEAKRLLLLVGLVFGLVLFVQHFELPYGWTSFFGANKSQLPSAYKFPMINVTDSNGPDEVIRTTKVSDGKGSNIFDVKNDFSSGNTKTFERTREDGGALPSLSAYVNSSSATYSGLKDEKGMLKNNEKHEAKEAKKKKKAKKILKQPVPISEMNDMLLKSRLSYIAAKPQWPSPADQELLNVQSLIVNAPIIRTDPQLNAGLYRNFSAFKRSYELMEQTLKVHVYVEGDGPIFHQPRLHGIYASEGWFMKQMEENKQFISNNPQEAHLFYIPFSSRLLELALYVNNSHNHKPLLDALNSYIQMISTKYNFWNRTGGSDHFVVASHDWAPSETLQTMPNCIRSLCNADVHDGFQFGKDASLPQTYVRSPHNPHTEIGGNPPSKRQILAFFAGKMHGDVRPILLKHWENKDPDMKIFGQLGRARGQITYARYMKSSKYCICAKGFEVSTPRVVEAIFYECVPVIISDNFVPPFFETLNWESFALFILEKDIPNLKNILTSIPQKSYLKMQRRVRQVQKHFLWNLKPVKYDVFHMILHSVWHNRVFQTRPW